MPKKALELTALQVRRLKAPGNHPVGGIDGLLLRITPTGGRQWLLRIQSAGRRRDFGLGGYPTVTLEEARERARELRKQVLGGLDPVAERRAARAATLPALGRRRTYREVAIECYRSLVPSFRNPKHGAQWLATQETYVFPVLGDLSVDQVDTTQVLNVLRPIWETKPETSSRLRGRIQKVLDYAKVCGYRAGDNPAAWGGNIKFALPPPRKIRAVEHHSAMPIDEVPAFVRRLRDLDTVASRALEFLILTAARSGEVRLAQPAEFNLKAKLWTIPGERMKAGLPHKVPLSARAMEILAAADFDAVYIFPGRKGTLTCGSIL
jgi:integrase